MKLIKTATTLLLALILTLGLTSCGSGTGTTEPSAPSTNAPNTPNTPTTNIPSTSTPLASAPTYPNSDYAIIKSEDMLGHEPNAKYGGHLRFVPLSITNMNKSLGLPWEHQIGGAQGLLGVFCETLLVEHYLEEGTEFVGWLAEDWTIDMVREEVVFKLREGIKFHDGSDFNAEAVAWNINMAVEGMFVDLSITGAEVRSEYEVAVKMNPFSNVIWSTYSTRPFGFTSKENYDNNGRDYAEKNAVGTGPFILKEHVPGVGGTFERNDQYWIEGRPYLDSVELPAIFDVMIQNASMQVTNAEAIDILATLSPEQIQEISRYPGMEIFEVCIGPLAMVPTSLNEGSPLANRDVRQAISHAVDRELIVEARGFGLFKPEYQFFPDAPGIVGRLPEADYYVDYNPAKARELIAQAGYPNGFPTTIYGNASGDREIALAIQEMLKAVGIDVSVEFPEQGAMTDIRARGYEGFTYGQIRAFSNVLRTFNLHMDTAYLQNIYTWRPVEILDPIYKSAISAPYLRAEDAQALNKVIMDNLCVIPIFVSYSANINRDYVRGTMFNELGMTEWMVSSIWFDR